MSFSLAESDHLPSWVKNNAKWWSEGQIPDSDFFKAIQYLIDAGIIRTGPKITCGEGTELVGNVCQIKNAPIQCQVNEQEENGTCVSISQSKFYGPLAYDSFDASPFKDMETKHSKYWYFEDFEKGASLPGINFNPEYTVGKGHSVDYDDGLRDQLGQGSNIALYGPLMQIIFDKDVLGEYPTHVGFVITSGGINRNNGKTISFEVYDSSGELIQTAKSVQVGYQGTSTKDDVFMGIFNENGIKSIKLLEGNMGDRRGWTTLDHFQYGR